MPETFRAPPIESLELESLVNWDSPQSRGLVAWYPFWLERSVPASVRGWLFGRYGLAPQNSPANIGDGVFGRSINFVASGSQSLLSGTTPVSAPPLSMSCWFRANDNVSNRALIGIHNSTALANGFLLIPAGAISGKPLQFYTQTTTTGNASTTTGFSANTWHHGVGVTSSVASRSVYLDGGSKGTDATSSVPSSTPNSIAIGARYNSGTLGLQWDGRIAEVRIYDRALSDAEVYSHWHPDTRFELYRRRSRRRIFVMQSPAFKAWWASRVNQLSGAGVNV